MTPPLPVPAPAAVVLGSRSPQRYELLSLLVGRDRVQVVPPADGDEAGFDGVDTLNEISDRLQAIARHKNEQVRRQLEPIRRSSTVGAIVTADTVIIARNESGMPLVLGQPPRTAQWRDTVREWFDRYLLPRPHIAATAVCVSTIQGPRWERVVSTDVTFRPDAGPWLEWYLNTEEPCGKAGGYALQGAGSLFVQSLEGSPSNVVGLPLAETAQLLAEVGVLI